jgi:hypothetical protein
MQGDRSGHGHHPLFYFASRHCRSRGDNDHSQSQPFPI